MHILITDSGVGGLSVVAYAERFVDTHGFTAPVKLTFANAALKTTTATTRCRRGSEARDVRPFLRNVTERFAPDSIVCRLQPLLCCCPRLRTSRMGPSPSKGSSRAAPSFSSRSSEPDSRTWRRSLGHITFDAGAYPRRLEQRGIEPSGRSVRPVRGPPTRSPRTVGISERHPRPKMCPRGDREARRVRTRPLSPIWPAALRLSAGVFSNAFSESGIRARSSTPTSVPSAICSERVRPSRRGCPARRRGGVRDALCDSGDDDRGAHFFPERDLPPNGRRDAELRADSRSVLSDAGRMSSLQPVEEVAKLVDGAAGGPRSRPPHHIALDCEISLRELVSNATPFCTRLTKLRIRAMLPRAGEGPRR